MHAVMDEVLMSAVGQDSVKLMQSYREAFERSITDNELTRRIDGHSFYVALKLPGIVIDCNGYVEPGKPGEVNWLFKGKDLHDKDMRLYALSVVEH